MTKSGILIETVESIDSTNAELMRRAALGETGPLWLRADRQTGGKGRSGRSWSSPHGNLYASLLTRLDVPPERACELSLVAGVALHTVIAQHLPHEAATGRLYLKWPNDLLLDAGKLAGILIETSITANQPGITAVIGIGVNVASHPLDIGRPATHLALHGTDLQPSELLLRIVAALDLALRDWRDLGFAPVRTEWLARAHLQGVEISVTTRHGPMQGLFTGLAEDGALMVKSEDGTEHRVTFGDVTIL